jgi:hypothetical protein
MLLGTNFISMSVLPGTPIWAILVLAYPPLPTPHTKCRSDRQNGVAYRAVCHVHRCLFFLMGLSMMDLKNLLPVLADSKLTKLNLGAFLYRRKNIRKILIFLVFSFFCRKANINKIYARALGHSPYFLPRS